MIFKVKKSVLFFIISYVSSKANGTVQKKHKKSKSFKGDIVNTTNPNDTNTTSSNENLELHSNSPLELTTNTSQFLKPDGTLNENGPKIETSSIPATNSPEPDHNQTHNETSYTPPSQVSTISGQATDAESNDLPSIRENSSIDTSQNDVHQICSELITVSRTITRILMLEKLNWNQQR